jgi:isochorismate hydrolase
LVEPFLKSELLTLHKRCCRKNFRFLSRGFVIGIYSNTLSFSYFYRTSEKHNFTMKRLLSLAFILFVQFSAVSQQKDNETKTALLIVDIQNFYFPGEGPGLVNAEQASLNAKDILRTFREREQLVVHVRHQAAKGFEIHENVKPVKNEKVITKQEVSSFLNTDLLGYLNSHNINRLVIIGMQTHMCLEAAVRAGHDLGFECVVIEDACATKDLVYNGVKVKAEDVHASTLATLAGGGYANVIDLDIFKENTEKYLFQKLD